MKPLREQFDSSDATERAAASLLAHVLPLEQSTSRMRRVRIRLSDRSEFRVMPLIRTAAIGAVLLAGVTASAMAGRAFLADSKNEPETAAPVLPSPAPAKPKARAVPIAQPERVEPTEVEAPSDADSTTSPSNAAQNNAPRAARSPTPSASNPGAKLMMQAMKARRDGDTARAAELLKEYRRKYPDGTLQEEALALSIEAAAARGDATHASRLARQYLDRYPQGRFKDQAQRVLRSSQ